MQRFGCARSQLGKVFVLKTRMHERERRGHGGIPQIVVILFHLLGHQHALVSQRARRQAGDVKPVSARNFSGVTDSLLRDFADDVKFPFKRRVVLDGRISADENLRHERLGGHGGFAERGIVHRHIAPAENSLAFAGNDFGKFLFDRLTLGRIFRQEQLADAVLTGRGKFEIQFCRFRDKKFMRHLDQDARAVARVRLAADRAAMIEIHQNFQRVGNQLVRLRALHVDDKAETAGIVFKLRVVKSLFRRRGNHRLRVPAISIICQVAGHRSAD